MMTIILGSALVGGIVMYGVRGWEQREAERANARDTSPHVGGDLTAAEQAEYAAAHDDDLDDPQYRDIVDALRMIPTHAEDGCFMADHVLGVHSPDGLRIRGDR